jgi:hypothetical protein
VFEVQTHRPGKELSRDELKSHRSRYGITRNFNGGAAAADSAPATTDAVADLGARRAVPAGNGKLMASKAGGVPGMVEPVTSTGSANGNLSEAFTNADLVGKPTAQSSREPEKPVLHPASPAEITREGEAALTRLIDGGRDWSDWVSTMKGLGSGRTYAMHEARTNSTKAWKFRNAMTKWLRLHPIFAEIDDSNRSKLLKCYDRLGDLEDWRHDNPGLALRITYPPTILSRIRAEEKKQQGKDGTESEGEGKSDGEGEGKGEREGKDKDENENAPKLIDLLKAAGPEKQHEILVAALKDKTRPDLVKLLSRDQLQEIGNHVLAQREINDCTLAQEINATPMPRKNVVGDLRVALTRIIREIATAPNAERRATAVDLLIKKCAASHLPASRLVVGHRDYSPPPNAQKAAKRKSARDL